MGQVTFLHLFSLCLVTERAGAHDSQGKKKKSGTTRQRSYHQQPTTSWAQKDLDHFAGEGGKKRRSERRGEGGPPVTATERRGVTPVAVCHSVGVCLAVCKRV